MAGATFTVPVALTFEVSVSVRSALTCAGAARERRPILFASLRQKRKTRSLFLLRHALVAAAAIGRRCRSAEGRASADTPWRKHPAVNDALHLHSSHRIGERRQGTRVENLAASVQDRDWQGARYLCCRKLSTHTGVDRLGCSRWSSTHWPYLPCAQCKEDDFQYTR